MANDALTTRDIRNNLEYLEMFQDFVAGRKGLDEFILMHKTFKGEVPSDDEQVKYLNEVRGMEDNDEDEGEFDDEDFYEND